MGILSDTLEANRDNTPPEAIDPTMFSSISRSFYYLPDLDTYKEPETVKTAKENMRMSFLQERTAFERLKAEYLIGEEIVRNLIDRKIIQSAFMNNKLEILRSQLSDAYNIVCQLCDEITDVSDSEKTFEPLPTCEENIRKDILDRLIKTTFRPMKKGKLGDHSKFRKVVSDCAELIRYLTSEYHGDKEDKHVFHLYLTKKLGYKVSNYCKCNNCGELLLDDIAYCLNCYQNQN